MGKDKCENCGKEAGLVLIHPSETLSSVKIYDAAGGETRIEVKAYADNLDDASKKAQDEYDRLRKKYPTGE